MLTLSYQSILHLLSYCMIVNASWIKNDHYFSFDYQPQGTTVIPVWKNNSQRSLYVVTSLHKTFSKCVSLKTALSYNRMESLMAQNGTTDTYKANVLSSNMNFLLSSLSWLSVSYALTGNISWYDNNADSRLRSIYNQINITFYPIDILSFDLSLDNQITEISHGNYSNNTFLDASAEYKLSKRTRISVKAANILNRKNFINASKSLLNYSYYSCPLRGREVLLCFSFTY